MSLFLPGASEPLANDVITEYLDPLAKDDPILASVGIRRRLDCIDETWSSGFVTCVREWFKHRGWVVLATSFGFHFNASYPHMHFHALVSCPKILSNPMATFKRDFQTTLFARIFECAFSNITGLIGGDRWTSIKMKLQAEDCSPDVIKFLGYPFKEANDATLELFDNPHYNNLETYDASTMYSNANRIYKSGLKSVTKKALTEARQKSEWIQFVELCDDMPQNFDQMVVMVLLHYKMTVDNPPHPKVLVQRTEKYCFKKGIIDIEEFVVQYSPFQGLKPKDIF